MSFLFWNRGTCGKWGNGFIWRFQCAFLFCIAWNQMPNMPRTLIYPRPVCVESCSLVSVWTFVVVHAPCFPTINWSHLELSNHSQPLLQPQRYTNMTTLLPISESNPEKVNSVSISLQWTLGRLKWGFCQSLGPALSTCMAVPGSSVVYQIHMKVSITARYCQNIPVQTFSVSFS